MAKKNVLLVITKLELGGAQKQVLTLLKEIDRGIFNPFLFTAKEGLLCKEAGAIPGLTIHFSPFLERRINPLKDFLAFVELVIYIRRNRITAVHTHSSKAGILGRCAAFISGTKRIIHTVHGWSFNDFQNRFCRRYAIWLERAAATFTDRIVVVCEADLKSGLQEKIGGKEKYILIRHGIDFSGFGIIGKGVRPRLGIGENDLLVGSVACLKPQKGPQDFIRFAYLVSRRIPDVKFLLIGDGELRPQLERLILSLGLSDNVILAGWRTDLPALLSALDLFVLTSLWEGLPLSVLEAMYSGLTVLVTQTGGVSEFVSPGITGFLFSPRDPGALAAKAVELLRDPEKRRVIGDNARKRVQGSFGVAEMAEKVSGLYF